MNIDLNQPYIDQANAFNSMIRRLQVRLPEIFGVQGRDRSITLEEVKPSFPAGGLRDYKAQLKAKLQDGDYVVPIKGRFVIRDANGKVVEKTNAKTILKVPMPTGRGTFLVGGNEYAVKMLKHQKPGVYTYHGKNDVRSVINTSTKQSPTLVFDPEKNKMTFSIGGRNFGLRSVMNVLGVKDSELRDAWGEDILFANKGLSNPDKLIDRLYDTMLKYDPEGRVSSREEKLTRIKSALAQSKLDPWTTNVTMGKEYHRVTPELFLDASSRMLKVNAGKVPDDVRDALHFQTFHGFDDSVLFGLEKEANKITSKIRFRLDDPNMPVDKVVSVPIAHARSATRGQFTKSNTSSTPDQVNPLDMKANANEVSSLGEGAIGSVFSITDSLRRLDDSNMGFMDPIHTPTTQKIGVSLHLAKNVHKKGDQIYKTFTVPGTGKRVKENPTTIYDKYVALPGTMKADTSGNLKPVKPRVRALYKGKVVTVSAKDVDLYMGGPNDIFDDNTSLVPFLGSNNPVRIATAVKQMGHSLPLVEKELPLVRSMGPGGKLEGVRFAENILTKVPSYIKNGTIKRVGKDSIVIADDKGKEHKIQYYNNFPLNSETTMNESPVVKAGDIVKSGDVLAANDFVKDGALALGRNLHVAFLPWKGMNYMDGLVVSESAAQKMAALRQYRTEHEKNRHDVFSKKKFLAHNPTMFTKEQSSVLDDDGIVREGTVVTEGMPLMVNMKPRKISQDSLVRGQTSKVFNRPFVNNVKTWDHGTEGIVRRVVNSPTGVKIYVSTKEPVKRGDKLCMTDDHDVLTSDGWVSVADLSKAHSVCTLNPDTDEIEYHKPTKLTSYHHEGSMYQVQSQQVDQCVTLDHKMYVQPRSRRDKPFALHRASDIIGKRVRYKKDGIWNGKPQATFSLPRVEQRAHGYEVQPLPDVQMNDWLEFLGYYLADGSCTKSEYYVNIHKNRSTVNSYGGQMYPKIIACLERMNWRYYAKDDRIVINSRQLGHYLRKLGHANDKYIPREFLGLAKVQLKALMDALLSCDGSKFSCVSYSTTSKQLADDIQELALKIGWAGTVSYDDPLGENHSRRYRVGMNRTKLTPQVNHGHANAKHDSLIDFDGDVYCCTVPNHVMYVRRNGKTSWTGNSNRYYAKGVIGAVLPDDEMPRNKKGEIVDLIQNPAAVPSRMNFGQIMEAAAAKLAKKTGKPYYASTIDPEGNDPRKLYAKMMENNVPDKEVLYDKDGDPIASGNKIFTGYQYFSRQKQQAEKYYQARNAHDPYDVVSRRPIKGPKVGPLGYYALLAHGAHENLKEIATIQSEQNDDYWNAVESGTALPAPKAPFAFDKLQNFLKGAGINVRKEGEDYRLLPMTDKQVMSLSNGEVGDPGRMVDIGKPGKFETLQATPNGLYDRKLFGGFDGAKWGHIDLGDYYPNPTFERALRSVTGLKSAELRGLVDGSHVLTETNQVLPKGDGVSGITGGQALKSMLDGIDVDAELKSLSSQIPNAKDTNKSNLIKRARYLAGLKRVGMSPADAYLMSKVPVLPAKFRPVYMGDDKSLRVSDFSLLYKDMGLIARQLKDADRLPESVKGEMRSELYDAVNALQVGTTGRGTGPKEKAGILSYLKGPSPSQGHFMRNIFSKRRAIGGRAVIMPNPSLGIDEVGIPEDMAWHTMESFVIQKLTSTGMPPLAAKREYDDRTIRASGALDSVLRERPIFLSRDPKLHKFNTMAFWARRVAGKAIEIPPLICKGFNADFDGDAMSVSVPIGAKAVKEAISKMMPSQNLFKAGSDSVIMRPEEDTIAGIFAGTRIRKNTKKTFSDFDSVMQSYDAKDLKLDDGVYVKGQLVSPGRIMFNEGLPEDERNYTETFDNDSIGAVLNRIAKKDPNSYASVLTNMKDNGDSFGTTLGISFSLKDFFPVDTEEVREYKANYQGGDISLPDSVKKSIERRIKNSVDPNSALALLADSGAKGSWSKLQQGLYSPITASQIGGGTVPYVMTSGYAGGMDFEDYWNSMKGARQGMYASAVEVSDPGYFSKQMLRANAGFMVAPGDKMPSEGLEYPVDHPTVMSRYLATDLRAKDGQLIAAAGDPIDSDTVNQAKAAGIKNVFVRSPLTSVAPSGIYARDFGRLPGGVKPSPGDDIGVIASHTLTEPAVQLTLRAFHAGGGGGGENRVKGLYAIWPLLNGLAPAGDRAAMSPYAGKVQSINKLESGASKITFDSGKSVTTYAHSSPSIKIGDNVKSGDQLQDGYMDPKEMLKYRGLRPLQTYLVDQIEANYDNNAPDRRYIEAVVAGLTRYGRVLNPGSNASLYSGDVMPINQLRDMNRSGEDIEGNVEYEPIFVGMDNLLSKVEPDWTSKMMGADMVRQLQDSAAFGLTSATKSPRPILPYIHGSTFGDRARTEGLY